MGVEMAAATLVIAVLALVVSCLSLGWQIVSFSLSGRRVEVDLSIGWRGPDQLLLSTAKQKDDLLRILSELAGRGPRIPVIGITVFNVGRADLYVSAVLLFGSTPGSSSIPAESDTWPALPCILRSGDSENWILDLSEIRGLCEKWHLVNGTKGAGIEFRAELKDGRTVPVRRKVSVEELRLIWNVITDDETTLPQDSSIQP
jgi:hypothetical protein